jgi:hypothetical protein
MLNAYPWCRSALDFVWPSFLGGRPPKPPLLASLGGSYVPRLRTERSELPPVSDCTSTQRIPLVSLRSGLRMAFFLGGQSPGPPVARFARALVWPSSWGASPPDHPLLASLERSSVPRLRTERSELPPVSELHE